MRYNKIRKMDISNGPGVRVSIFMQGCTFNCKNCFNPETHDFRGGEEFTDETIEKVLSLGAPEYIKGLSILGGEPMHPINAPGTEKLAKAWKEKYPNKSIWTWSGFLFENLKDRGALKYIDILVDGQFVEEQKDFRLKYCGSKNQRIVDVQRSLREGRTVVLTEEDVAKLGK